VNRTALRVLLRKHEGLRLKVYSDSTGHATIGYGRNLENGISDEEAAFLLENDITRVLQELIARVPCFGSLPDPQQIVLVDMAFNLGIEGLLRFTHFLDAVEARDFEKAAEEMLASKWAKQVGERATELAALMASGQEDG